MLARLGAVSHLRGNLDQAAERLTRAASELRAFGDAASEAESLVALARVHSDAGRLDVAEETAGTALRLARDLREARFEPRH